MTPATWDGILQIINDAGREGITNQQINAALGSSGAASEFYQREGDVSALTRVMAKAGVVDVSQRVRSSTGNIYYPIGRKP